MDPSPDESDITAPSTVDALLERYLALLDEYTSLRAELSRLQAATFQHLARANFAAERGARYGADAYDDRMQALRTVVIGEEQLQERQQEAIGSAPTFQVVVAAEADRHDAAGGAATAEPPREEKKGKEDAADDGASSSPERPGEAESARRSPDAKTDPLRWFGVLTPLALRQTQACAVETVGRVVPRLATVDAAMRAVEIEVRRARKRRAKAEAAAAAAAAAEREDGQRELGQERVAREEVPAS